MNTFFQVVGCVALSVIVCILADMIFFGYWNWRDAGAVLVRKKFASRYSGPRKKRQRTYGEGHEETPT